MSNEIPKYLVYLGKIANSREKSMTKTGWCNFVDEASGNRNKIIQKFISLGILQPDGRNENNHTLYIVNNGKLHNYARQSQLYTWLKSNKKVFSIWGIGE